MDPVKLPETKTDGGQKSRNSEEKTCISCCLMQKDYKSEYKDELFSLYHFPASYRSRINTGDIFIYNQAKQGQSGRSNVRYYYGTGTIGEIYTLDSGETYFAELKNCKAFYNNVPLKLEDNTYIEQLEYESKRKQPNWQSSIREISASAFSTIINMSGGLVSVSKDVSIESLKSDLKASMDELYLNDNHQALVDVIAQSTMLIQKFGAKVN